MSEKIYVGKLSTDQTAALFTLFMQLDEVRLARNNILLAALAASPDMTVALIEILREWSADMNLIGERSDAEISRIVAGIPRQTN